MIASPAPPGARPTRLRRLRRLSGWAVVGLWATLGAASLSMIALGQRPLTVEGASMRPAIESGDVVVNESIAPGEARAGDVVTFSAPEMARTTTHRVVEVQRRGDVLELVTKGDANLAAERWTASPGAVIGRVVYRIPRLGHLIGPSRTTVGRIAFVAVGALVLAFLLALIWLPARGPRSAAGWVKPEGPPVDR